MLTLPSDLLATPHRFLLHTPSNTAILADLHLGAEAELSRRGIFMPDTSSVPLRNSFEQLAAVSPARFVIAGDLFDTPNPSDAAIQLAHELLSLLPNTPFTLIPGNHDPSPKTLANLFPNATITTHLQLDRVLITHGHEPFPPNTARTLVTGHQHPAVILKSRIQSAKMPCYALCKIPNQNLLLLPAFSRAPLGSNLLTQHHWLLPTPRPSDDNIQILGLIESPNAPPQLLDFGPLSALPT